MEFNVRVINLKREKLAQLDVLVPLFDFFYWQNFQSF